MRSRDGFMGSKWWERQDGRRRNEMYFLHVPVFFLFTCFLLFLFFYRGTVVSPFALFFFCRCFTSVCFACVLLCFASGTFLQTVYATSLPHVDPKYTSQAARLLPPSPPPLLLLPPCGPEIDVASGFVAVSFGGNI